MTFSPRDRDQHQITPTRPTYIVVEEEDYRIDGYGDYYLQRPRSGRWLIALALAVGVIWLLFPGIFHKQQLVVAPSIAPTSVPMPLVDITEIRQTLYRQLDFEVREFSVTTIVTLKQNNNDFLWIFPVDQTSVDYHAVGYVTVGYDLTQASVIEGDDGNLHVFLPMPTVLDVDVQPELSYFNVDVPANGSIEPETMTAILSRVENALEQAAYDQGLVAEANNSGPQLIGYDLFPGTGNLIFYTQSPTGVSQ